MSIKRVALIFDNAARPDTTGTYCRRALGRICGVEHFLPTELGRLRQEKFDLYLAIDDGLNYTIPSDLRPLAYWAIDTHLDFERELRRAKQADFVFAAQRDGAEHLRQHGIESACWLPLACDPDIHGRQVVAKKYDVAFVGNIFPGPREELLRAIRSAFPNTFVGRRFFADMARIYSESRIIFNRSLRNDVNMRVFEALASGSLLLTNDLRENGQEQLFQDGTHLATYAGQGELVEKVRFYLANGELRERIAEAGRQAVLDGHTYVHRMQTILSAVEASAQESTQRAAGFIPAESGSGKGERETSRQGERTPNSGSNTTPLTPDPSPGGRGEKRKAATAAKSHDSSYVEAGKTSIILVTHNQLDYTQLCLDSIRYRTAEPYELIVVDNASTDGTLDYLRPQEHVRLIANSENRGFPAAANQGILAAKGDALLLLNNDTVVTTGWLRRLRAALYREPDIGLVGPCSNRVSGPQQIPVDYKELKAIDGFAWDWAQRHAGERVPIDRLVGFCLLFRREVVERIGLLDERFGIGNFEDDDFCRRAINAGFRAEIAVDAFVHHFGHATFQGSRVDLGQLLAENQRKYEEKWSGREETRRQGDGETRREIEDFQLQMANCKLAEDSVKSEIPNPKSEMSAAPSPDPPCPPLAKGGNVGMAKSEIPNPKSEITLSLCMIVRDNETTIGPCLKSIRPWVDEIVVVDTGSKDRTPQICAEFGARLHEFPWCDDFSAARNESLKHARGEWIFWMDSDDTISEVCGRKLRELADAPHPENVLGYIMQVHCPGPDEDGHRDVTVVDHVKLIRNRSDLRFDGRIHEQILPAIRRAGGEVAWTDIYVVHSGSDHSLAGSQKKLERDLRILHRELQERPEHPFVLFNLGMTYADAKRYDEAIDYLKRCIQVSKPEESHLRKAYALLVSSLGQADRHDEAWELCQRARSIYPEDKELLFRCAMLHHHFGRLAEAEATYLQVLTGQEERHFTSVDRELAGNKARHNLAIVYDDMGRFDRAEQQWRQIVQDGPGYTAAWRGLGEALLKQGKDAEVAAIVGRLVSRPQTRSTGRLLEARLSGQRGDYIAARRALEAALRESPESIDPLQELCRLIFEHGTPQEGEAALRQLIRREPEDAAAWHNLGTVVCQLGRFDEAASAYRRSLELRPRHEPTIRQLEYVTSRPQRAAATHPRGAV
jgi:GT2 family glycosyltransferase/tetratricopeptide (TPR) repeat protein